MWSPEDWTTWNWLFTALSIALFWAVVIVGAVWAIRWSRPRSQAGPRQLTARKALDEQFARGEISEDEYRRAREALSSEH